MSVKQTLTDAREIISTPEKWTQGTHARNEYGEQTAFFGKEAVCFCLYGAIGKASINDDKLVDSHLSNQVERWLSDHLYTFHPTMHGIADFNDHSSHAEVLTMLDGAIASCP